MCIQLGKIRQQPCTMEISMRLIFYTLFLIASINAAAAQLSEKEDELLNWCIDGVNHKQKPGPEDELHQQCSPWKDRSCCTHNVSRNLHAYNMYNFDWEHCGPMSDKCKRHFIQDLCFYECEPNLGPWVVKVDMKIRKERAFGVPLCASDCEDWYNDCKNESTCVENWTRDFVWINKKNTCPLNSTCRSFSSVYNNSAKTFCESVWDHAWAYTPDNQSCMRLWFNGTLGNPNDKVAKEKVAQMYSVLNNNSNFVSSFGYLYIILTVTILNFI